MMPFVRLAQLPFSGVDPTPVRIQDKLVLLLQGKHLDPHGASLIMRFICKLAKFSMMVHMLKLKSVGLHGLARGCLKLSDV